MLLLVRLVAAGTGGHASPDGLVMGAVKDEDGLSTRSVPTVRPHGLSFDRCSNLG